jgi:hypothetical protein
MTHPLFADLMRTTGNDPRAAAILALAREVRGVASALRSLANAVAAKQSDRPGANAFRVSSTGRGRKL